MLYTSIGRQHYGIKDWLLVMWHGLPIDLSVAAYLTVLPVLFVIVSVWIQSFRLKSVMRVYDLLVSWVIAFIFVGDAALYPFWGFKLDASVFFYLRTPKEAFASISALSVVLGIVAVVQFTVSSTVLSDGRCSLLRLLTGKC